ncbi:MAG TPA: hypothetical protein VGS28_04240 [Candidatus Saccharimonadales bacterium]|nr:hypothetical protein [Candidatus Saccharimonadales bacterium]
MGEPLPDKRWRVRRLQPYILSSPAEKVVRIVSVPRPSQNKYPSAVKAMLWLTGAQSRAEIGKHGPAVASLPFPEHGDEPNLNKFGHVFGRDSLIIGLAAQEVYPNLLPTTLRYVATKQGIRNDPVSGEQTGKIFHDDNDPESPLGRKFMELFGWKFPFYATVDATPLFIQGIHRVLNRHDPDFLSRPYEARDGFTRTMASAFFQSAMWLLRETNSRSGNEEGLLEFGPIEAKGMESKSWKDSYHAYCHEDETIANYGRGIASLEAQAYAYDALLDAADIYRGLGNHGIARAFATRAEQLRQIVLETFWVEDEHGGYFASGTDRDDSGRLRVMRVRTSSMGHLLNSRILDGNDPEVVRRREAVIRTLFTKEMFAPTGIRTMGSGEVLFNPTSYHNGGIWPWDNGWIALGLERHGYNGLAWKIWETMLTDINATRCFPEVLRGGDRLKPTLNKKAVYVHNKALDMTYLLERPPQEIQGWTTIMALLAKRRNNPLVGRETYTRLHQATDTDKRALEEDLLANLSYKPKVIDISWYIRNRRWRESSHESNLERQSNRRVA